MAPDLGVYLNSAVIHAGFFMAIYAPVIGLTMLLRPTVWTGILAPALGGAILGILHTWVQT